MKVQQETYYALSFACFFFLLNLVTSASLTRDEKTSAECRGSFGYKYYYDHGTETCEQCREICQYAEITRTVEQCQSECSRYLTAMQCADKKDQYYDEVLDTCSSCSVLCDNHQVAGTTRTCREQCSAYLEKLSPKQVASHHRQNYLKAVDGSDREKESRSADLLLHPGWIAAISVGGVAFVCLIVVVVILYWTFSQQRQQQKYGHAPQQDNEEEAEKQRRSQRPVEETIQASQDSPHFAIDAGSQGLPPTVGFRSERF